MHAIGLSHWIINTISITWSSYMFLNTSYLADSYTVFTLKLVSGQNFCFSKWIRSSRYGKQKISDTPPCGKGKKEGGKIVTIVYQLLYHKLWIYSSNRFDSSVSRATDVYCEQWVFLSSLVRTRPWYFYFLFFCIFLSS